MKVTFLLGSGFSKPLGLPLAYEINERFTGQILNNLLQQSSGEWGWVQDNDRVMINNGKLSSRVPPFEYLFEVLVNEYLETKSAELNYEEFYHWVINLKQSELDAFFLKASKAIEGSKYSSEFKTRMQEELSISPLAEVFNCLNHLIADMLRVKKDENISNYDEFIQIIKENLPISIFTLNHDLIVEGLLKRNNIEYSTGFNSINSTIVGDKKNLLKIFQDVFDKGVGLYKLHGSIDVYRFDVMTEMQDDPPLPPSWVRTGEYEYFKAGYYDKHYVSQIDKEGNVIQPYNTNIAPQFLSGNSKAETIKKDKVYSKLFDAYKKQLTETDVLCVIGYSFNDVHVNDEISKVVEMGTLKRIINVNPNCPELLKDIKAEVIYLNSITELTRTHIIV